MSKTQSNMLPLGTKAAYFCLTDVVSDKKIRFGEVTNIVASVILFICNHCPYVKYINSGLIALAKDYSDKKIQFLAINSNDPETYPADSPENMKKLAEELGYPFPYLFDETQEVAKIYQAACTPDFYVFDSNNELVYRGQFDDARPGNDSPITGKCIRDTLDCLLTNKPVSTEQKPSLGCNIKWRN